MCREIFNVDFEFMQFDSGGGGGGDRIVYSPTYAANARRTLKRVRYTCDISYDRYINV